MDVTAAAEFDEEFAEDQPKAFFERNAGFLEGFTVPEIRDSLLEHVVKYGSNQSMNQIKTHYGDTMTAFGYDFYTVFYTTIDQIYRKAYTKGFTDGTNGRTSFPPGVLPCTLYRSASETRRETDRNRGASATVTSERRSRADEKDSPKSKRRRNDETK
jgi:hypothetical protein